MRRLNLDFLIEEADMMFGILTTGIRCRRRLRGAISRQDCVRNPHQSEGKGCFCGRFQFGNMESCRLRTFAFLSGALKRKLAGVATKRAELVAHVGYRRLIG